MACLHTSSYVFKLIFGAELEEGSARLFQKATTEFTQMLVGFLTHISWFQFLWP